MNGNDKKKEEELHDFQESSVKCRDTFLTNHKHKIILCD